MEFNKKYKKLYDVDITNIKTFVESLSDEEWNEWSFRQIRFLAHSKTKTYPLSWGFINHNEFNIILKNKNSHIWKTLNKEIVRLETYFNGKAVTIMFANLLPNGEITPHKDEGHFRKMHRCHLPIFTNKDVIFYLDQEPINLNEGTFYEINNQLIHSVKNNSTNNRVHLIIDILPKDSDLKINKIH